MALISSSSGVVMMTETFKEAVRRKQPEIIREEDYIWNRIYCIKIRQNVRVLNLDIMIPGP